VRNLVLLFSDHSTHWNSDIEVHAGGGVIIRIGSIVGAERQSDTAAVRVEHPDSIRRWVLVPYSHLPLNWSLCKRMRLNDTRMGFR
jgi:hypothetical protein